MHFVIVCSIAFAASLLAFFSGFGLGTVLMPALTLFLPVPVAIAATAVVHFANNLLKLFLVGSSANRSVLLRFALPAIVFSFIGAALLSLAAGLPAIAEYRLMGHLREITAIKLSVGLMIIVFSCLDLVPRFENIAIDRRYMILGGALSGFFGGFSGNQGAFRSMFLIKAGLSKEEFIGTGVVASVLVDSMRLLVYGRVIFGRTNAVSVAGLLTAAAIGAAFAGTIIGQRLLNKVTLGSIRIVIGVTLILLGCALSAGLL